MTAAEVEPRLTGATILEYCVGARHRRYTGVRVELKYVGELPAVHCYGQGFAGWTLAPTVAQEAAGLLANAAWDRKAG
jgi:hypothetical protein